MASQSPTEVLSSEPGGSVCLVDVLVLPVETVFGEMVFGVA
jgi:hypothetical protein